MNAKTLYSTHAVESGRYFGPDHEPMNAIAATPDMMGPDPRNNALLASLPDAVYRDLLPSLRVEPLPKGLALRERGSHARHAYFPVSGIVCLLQELEDGTSVQFALTGNEGMVGIPILLGAQTTPSRAVVLIPGYAYRIDAAVLKAKFERGGALQHLLLRYTQALITQITLTAICNRHHMLDQQFASWLLHCLDRIPGGEIPMTQELIATVLGVRREGITNAATKMRDRGIVGHFRGRIKVLDRAKLEASACECYAAIAHEYGRLLPSTASYGTRASLTSALRAPGIPALRMASQATR